MTQVFNPQVVVRRWARVCMVCLPAIGQNRNGHGLVGMGDGGG